MTQVRTICEGFVRRVNGEIAEAHSTSTLVTSGEYIIVVDTSDAGYRQKVLDGFDRLQVDRRQVNVIINTHLHADHMANNDLFPTAVPMAHRIERPPMTFRKIGGDIEICPGVRILHTPGHTPGHISVIVDADDGRYAIAGDAIPTKENYDQWVPPAVNFDTAMALDSMQRLVEAADVIIPGHGAPFRVEAGKH